MYRRGPERAPLARRPGCTGDRERVISSSMANARYPITPMTLGNMRDLGVRSLAVTCDLCQHAAVLPADRWPNAVLVRAFRPRMVCTRCGIVGADARPKLAGNEGERELASLARSLKPSGPRLPTAMFFRRTVLLFSCRSTIIGT